MSGYFITSTGTGVGKTFVTCAWLHAARAAGQTIRAVKPMLTGDDGGDTTDTARLLHAMGGGDANSISPWRFKAPLAPHRAAAQEHRAVDIEALVAWCEQQLAQPGLTLIEGVGGVMVPLTDTHTVLDWMRAQGVPVVLVVGSYLGSISHTLTALAALRSADLTVAALIINETAMSDLPLLETQAGLLPFIHDIPLRVLQPLVSSPAQAHAIHALCRELQ